MEKTTNENKCKSDMKAVEGDYRNDPHVVKKREKAIAILTEHGFPKEFFQDKSDEGEKASTKIES